MIAPGFWDNGSFIFSGVTIQISFNTLVEVPTNIFM